MQILAASLGDARLRELSAQGEATDADQTFICARRQIDEYLATLDEDA